MLLEIVFDFDKTDKSVEKISQISHGNKCNMFSLLHWIQHFAEIMNIILPLSCRFVSEGFFGFDPNDSRVPGLKEFRSSGSQRIREDWFQGFGRIEFQRIHVLQVPKDSAGLGFGILDFKASRSSIRDLTNVIFQVTRIDNLSFFTQILFEKTSNKCC